MVPQGSSNFVDSTTCIASGPGGGTSFGAGHVAGRCHSFDPSAHGCAPCQCCTDGSSAWSAFRAHGSASSCSLGGSTGRMPCTAWELSLGAQRSADAPQPMALSRKGLALSSWPQGNVPIRLLATRILAQDPVRPSNGLGTCTDVRSRFSGSAATSKRVKMLSAKGKRTCAATGVFFGPVVGPSHTQTTLLDPIARFNGYQSTS